MRKRPLGQHALASSTLASRLVADAGVDACHRVVEFGAGRGVLTAALAERAGLVIAVEVDTNIAPRLVRRFATASNVVVMTADAFAVPLPSSPFSVVANPPFAITTDLLHHLLDDPRVPMQRADLVVQWQVARSRVAFAAGSPTDLLAASWSPWWCFARGRRIPASCFRPRPCVDAAVLTITRRPDPALPTAAAAAYHRLVRGEFTRNGERARTFSPSDWLRLARSAGLHSPGSSANMS